MAERLKGAEQRLWQIAYLQFTFQYGEIKSGAAGTIWTSKHNIYIPVWRD